MIMYRASSSTLLAGICYRKLTGISIERLVSMCESLPSPLWFNGLSWGHDFRGFLTRDIEGDYSSMERFSRPSISTAYSMGAFSDPFQGVGFHKTCSATAQLPETTTHKSMSIDPFSQLPWELCEEILVSMPAQDALTLRLVSRTFLPLFSSTSFWLSRFEPDDSRGFPFEVMDTHTWSTQAYRPVTSWCQV